MTDAAKPVPAVTNGEMVQKDGVVVVNVPAEAQVAVLEGDIPRATLVLVNPQDKFMSTLAEGMDSLDWRNIKPPIMAMILMQIPRKTRGGGVMRLTYAQSLVFAMSAYEQGVSPLSTQIFFDPDTWRASVTLEGRQAQAQKAGLLTKDIQYEFKSREWADAPKQSKRITEAKAAGFSKDIGCVCQLTLEKDGREYSTSYLAWLSEWFMSSSPQWLDRPEHMLQVRSQEKAREAGGFSSGVSALPEEY